MPTRAGAGEPGERLRLVCYNVHGLGDDRAALASVVRGLAPDVIVVQEAPRRLRWRTRCADLAHSFGMFYTAGGLPSLGNVIITSLRVTVRDTWCVRYPLTPGRHMRGAAFARCEFGGRAFVVAGSHLSTDDAERPAQARLLAAALTAVDDPVLLGVDVNETDAGESWRLLAAGRIDAGAVSGEPTFPVSAPRRRIDGIFLDPGCAIESYQVVDGPAVRAASDHFPLLADLVLPPGGSGSPSWRT